MSYKDWHPLYYEFNSELFDNELVDYSFKFYLQSDQIQFDYLVDELYLTDADIVYPSLVIKPVSMYLNK